MAARTSRDLPVKPAFVESASFTRDVVSFGLEGELRRLQWYLSAHPDAGVLEPGLAGIRKIRVGDRGRGLGKSGGVRVHYLHVAHADVIYLLSIYRKSERSTLTADERRILRALVQRLKGEHRNASR